MTDEEIKFIKFLTYKVLTRNLRQYVTKLYVNLIYYRFL